MRWRDHVFGDRYPTSKSNDASYLSFTKELWEGAPSAVVADEVHLEGEVEATTVCWTVHRLGLRLAVFWTGTVVIRLDDGRRVELDLDDASVSGGPTSWTERWSVFRRAEPMVASLVPALPSRAIVEVNRLELASGARIFVSGSYLGAAAMGGYRDAARKVAFRVRLLQVLQTAQSSPRGAVALELKPVARERQLPRLLWLTVKGMLCYVAISGAFALLFWLLQYLAGAEPGGCG